MKKQNENRNITIVAIYKDMRKQGDRVDAAIEKINKMYPYLAFETIKMIIACTK